MYGDEGSTYNTWGAHSNLDAKTTPAIVNVAFEVLRWIQTLDVKTLSGAEKAVYEAALEVLRLYLRGEMRYATQPMMDRLTRRKSSPKDVKSS